MTSRQHGLPGCCCAASPTRIWNTTDRSASPHGWTGLRKTRKATSPSHTSSLVSTYRRGGQEEAARKVALAKRRRQRQVLNPPGKIWNWLLYLSIGYGSRTWLAGLWLLGLMLAGAAVFAHAYPADMIATSRHPMPFNAPIYTLDVLLPIINLGLQDSWQPTGIALWVYWALIILGWALTLRPRRRTHRHRQARLRKDDSQQGNRGLPAAEQRSVTIRTGPRSEDGESWKPRQDWRSPTNGRRWYGRPRRHTDDRGHTRWSAFHMLDLEVVPRLRTQILLDLPPFMRWRLHDVKHASSGDRQPPNRSPPPRTT